MEAGRFLALDSLRGILACTIVVFHLPSTGFSWRLSLFQHGFLAVTFFFVLSGFVIGETYGARLAAGFPVSRFLVLRLGRIYPLHLFMLAVLVAWEGIRALLGLSATRAGAPFTGEFAPWLLPCNLLLLQRFANMLSWNGPSWSIGVEWWTYIAFALAAAFTGRRSLIPTAGLLLIPAGLLRVGRYQATDGWIATIDCMLNFGLGLLVCQLRRTPSLWRHAERLDARAATLLEIATVVLALAMIDLFGGRLSPLISPTFALVVAVFSLQRGAVSRLLTTSPMLLLGELSYSIYMIHHFILDRMLDLLRWAGHHSSLPLSVTDSGRIVLVGPPLACDMFTLLVVAAVVAAARYSYRHVETPARLWSRRIVNPSHSAKVTPPDPTAAF